MEGDLIRQPVIVPTLLHQTEITRLKGLRAFSGDEDYTEIMVESPPVSLRNRSAGLSFYPHSSASIIGCGADLMLYLWFFPGVILQSGGQVNVHVVKVKNKKPAALLIHH